MNTPILVYLDLAGVSKRVGTLWTRVRNTRQSATFEYAREWLGDPNRFALEPALVIGPGPHHTPAGIPLFGSLMDSAPDRWGQVLMRRAERRLSLRERRAPRTMMPIDYLLRVHDVSRLGALRFAIQEDGPFLAESAKMSIPPFLALSRLLLAAERVMAEDESEDDLRLLLAPGSSLGGARPKASVFDILISNTDDHLRNHGFLFSSPAGWQLAPAYDMNPIPTDIKPRVLSTEVGMGDATASLDLAFDVAGYFELKLDEARCIAREVGRSVTNWRTRAAALGIVPREIDRMSSAFDHADLAQAME